MKKFFDRVGYAAIAAAFTILVIPIALALATFHAIELAGEFYGELLPRYWREAGKR